MTLGLSAARAARSVKDLAGFRVYLMPALHGPLSSLQHVAFMLWRFQDRADACAQALQNLPAVLWMNLKKKKQCDTSKMNLVDAGICGC